MDDDNGVTNRHNKKKVPQVVNRKAPKEDREPILNSKEDPYDVMVAKNLWYLPKMRNRLDAPVGRTALLLASW